jgi:uncharacterized surface protein with fasciclin (FAS1) repeats
MSLKKTLSLSTLVLVFLAISCREEFDKFERPEWLAGKVYTQILEIPELSVFARCVEITGYDKILDVSGSYTVFAPSNEAFRTWLAQNPKYNTVDDIPVPELTRIVKFHILQNPWTKKQLRSLDVYGWIDPLDARNNKASGFKRETLLLEANRKYGVIRGRQATITDTLESTWHRVVASDLRKYAPVFYLDYLNLIGISSADYQFYFNRAFAGGNNIHFANGLIESDAIFAENGLVYVIDQVVPPLRNAYQILEDNTTPNTFNRFRELVNEFSALSYNQAKTNQQPGVELGLQVDSLFDLSFPELTFNLSNEKTQAPSGTYGLPQNVTTRFHHGIAVPTDEAFQQFVQEYIQIPGGWGTLAGAPRNIRRIIANTHLSQNPVYPSSFEKGFLNGESDFARLDNSQIIHKEFGSNSSFIGLNKAIVPRAFSSITGSVYLLRGYSKMMLAIEEAGLLSTLKRENSNYMFFVESDFKSSVDSSLIYSTTSNSFSVILRGEEGNFAEFKLSRTSLRNLVLSHVAENQPKGFARKEFIPNMAGNYLIFNNETGEVRGSAPTTEGYMGNVETPEFPKLLKVSDNGVTYDIQNWFSFSSISLFSQISTRFPWFHALLQKAGLSLDKESRYSFISNSEYYTVFAPTQAAIVEAGLNSLPVNELRQILLLHFVQGEIIFTDGNKPAKLYETMRIDEKSTQFSTFYTHLNIVPDIDKIWIKDKNGLDYAEVNESAMTNILSSITVTQGASNVEEVFPNIVTTAVVHEVNKVFTVAKVGN